MSTFVSVGNATQPFARLLRAVQAMLPSLPQPVVVQYGSTPFSAGGCRAIPFLEMSEFGGLIRASSLLILHGGAGSVIHSVRAGKIPVVMPRLARYNEHVDDHQVEFAIQLEGLGRIIVAREERELESAVAKALERQANECASTGLPLMLRLVQARIDELAAAGKGQR